MKILLVIALLLSGIGQPKPKYPRVVHNICGKWAIEYDKGLFLSRDDYPRPNQAGDSLFYGMTFIYWTKYSLDYVGHELQCDDSVSAANTLRIFDEEHHAFNRAWNKVRREQDSIFKCLHTYN